MATVMGSPQAGLHSDPRWLASTAGGLLAAVAALWAMRGLPLGLASFWIAPFPLFAAGLVGGPLAAVGASLLAGVVIAFLANWYAGAVFLGAFGLPAALMALLAFRRGTLDAGRAAIVLGLWPAVAILTAGVVAAGQSGGLDGVLRKVTEHALAQAGVAAPEGAVAGMARIMPGAIGFWFAVLLAANAAGAQGFLARRGWALAATPRWSMLRLPRLYAVVPLVAAVVWLLVPVGADTVTLSVFMVTLLPVFLAGLAAVHRHSQGKPARSALLVGFYVGLVLLFLPAMAAVTAFGFWDQWGRRGASSGGMT